MSKKFELKNRRGIRLREAAPRRPMSGIAAPESFARDSGRRETFWHWPGWRQLGYALMLGLAVTVWFAATYGGADWLTEHRTYRVRLHLPIDLAMPLLPAMAVFYLSLNVLLWCAPFILRTRRELKSLAIALAAATAVAAVGFVLLPGQDAFPVPQQSELGGWASINHLARSLALSHNYLPSLHVAFTTIAVMVYAAQATHRGKALLWAWALAIVASTMLIHQHYIADVASGMLLGWLTVRAIYKPLAATPPATPPASPTAQTPPASHPIYQAPRA